MRYFVIFIAAVAVAALAFATAQNTRKYTIDNDLALDPAMSDGTPSVPCKNDLLKNAIRVRCPSHSSWQTVATHTEGTLTCPRTDSGIHWRNNELHDDDTYHTINWECGLDAAGVSRAAVHSEQTVRLTGMLSLCIDSSITASASCSYYAADGTDKGRKSS